MRDQKDNNTIDLFPGELIVTRLVCTSTALKLGKEETRVNMLLMLAKGDSHAASCAINTGYLRLVNADEEVEDLKAA